MKKGFKMTEEQRVKISKSHKGIMAGMSGKKHSEESKRKMSEAHKRTLMNPELRKKISETTKKAMASPIIRKKLSEASRGHTPWNKGIPHTEEHKRKLREARRKLLSNPEFRKKMSEAHKGQIPWNKGMPTTKEQIEKQKATYQKTLLSHPEIREKMSLAKKGKPSWNKGISMSEEARKKLSEARKGKRLSQKTEFKLGHIPWHKGKKGVYTPEQLKLMSAARKGMPAWNKGISPTREQIEKQRASIIKLTSNPEYRKQMSENFKKAWANPELRKKQSEAIKKYFSNPEARKKLAEALKGNIPWNFGKKTGIPAWNRGIPPPKEQIEKQRETIIKTFLANPEIIEKIREARLKQIFPVKDTAIEIFMQKELEKRKIKFKKHIAIIGQPDIFIEPNLCIFCDGDYWHANPLYVKESRIVVRKKTAKQIWENDKKVNNELNRRGFEILRFWESDIEKDVAKCVDVIEEVLAEKKHSEKY